MTLFFLAGPAETHPLRLVLDRHLRIPLTARLLRGADPEKTILIAGSHAPAKKVEAIQGYGATVWRLPLRAGRIPFGPLLKKLGKMGMLSVMIEGGGTTASRALQENVVDKVLFFYAPKILGGDGKDMIGALGIKQVGRCRRIGDVEVKKFGPDLLVSGYLK